MRVYTRQGKSMKKPCSTETESEKSFIFVDEKVDGKRLDN